MGVPELRRLRQLEEENAQLKKLVADLSLDRQMLQDIVKKSCKGLDQKRAGRIHDDRISGIKKASLPDTADATLKSVLQAAPARSSIVGYADA